MRSHTRPWCQFTKLWQSTSTSNALTGSPVATVIAKSGMKANGSFAEKERNVVAGKAKAREMHAAWLLFSGYIFVVHSAGFWEKQFALTTPDFPLAAEASSCIHIPGMEFQNQRS